MSVKRFNNRQFLFLDSQQLLLAQPSDHLGFLAATPIDRLRVESKHRDISTFLVFLATPALARIIASLRLALDRWSAAQQT
jgi:hypothetical protein